MELKLSTTDDAYTHIVLSGKLDVAGVHEIENKFITMVAAHKRNALVDISQVNFMGSMGLRLFLAAAKSLSWEKKTLILLNPQPMVDEVLVASGFNEVVVIEHNTESAIKKAKA